MRTLCALWVRPIAEHERRALLAIVAVGLTAVTLLLALTRPAPQHHATKPPAEISTDARATKAQPALSPAAVRASRAFLSGYLAYIDGHTPASHIQNATGALLRSLQAQPPRVSPAMAASHPHVLSLTATTAPAGLLGVRALVNDGTLIDYPVALQLASRGGRLLVTALEQN